MSNKSKDKKTEKKLLTKTMSDKMFAKYIQDATEVFDLRFTEMHFECEDCGELHDPVVVDDMFNPRFYAADWESYMTYDLPEPEEMRELLREAISVKIEEFLDMSVADIQFFFNHEKKHYPEFLAEKKARQEGKEKLTKELTKEQWEAIYSVYPVVKRLDEHEAKHLVSESAETKLLTESTKTDYELN